MTNKFVCLRLMAGLLLAATINSSNFATGAKAQALEVGAKIGAVALEGLTMKAALDRFDDLAQRTVNEGERVGNGMVIRFGTEMELAIANSRVLLEDQQEMLNQTLTGEQVAAFTKLNGVIEKASKALKGEVTRGEELLRIDVKEWIAEAFPWKDDAIFLVTSIAGITLVKQDAPYQVKFTGLGLGFMQDGEEKARSHLLVRDQTIDVAEQRQPEGGRLSDRVLVLHLPPTLFESLDWQVVTKVPAKLVAEVTRDAPWWKVWESDKTSVFEVPFHFILLPKIAGHVIIRQEMMVQVPEATKHQQLAFTTHAGQCSSGSPCWYKVNFCPPGRVKITSVSLPSFSGDACRFSYPVRGGITQGDKDAIINGDKTCALIQRKHDGADGNCTTSHTVTWDTLTKKSVPGDPESERDLELRFGEEFEWVADDRNENCIFKIEGRLVTGHSIKLDQNTAPNQDQNDFLIMSGYTPRAGDGSPCRATFRLRNPF